MDQDKLAVPTITQDQRLAGLTAIITGGGSAGAVAGSGAALCVTFAAKGARVVIVDLDEERARHTQEALGEDTGSSEVVVADITVPRECERVIARCRERFGTVNILVNNAAIAPDESGEPDLAVWDAVLRLDLTAAKLMTDAALPSMRESGQGSIVNIASVAGVLAGGGAAYSAAKAGLIGYGRAVALHEGRAGIRVNAVVPGHLLTPMGMNSRLATDSARVRRAQASMLGTEGTAWDIANAALFLASEESRYITGQTIVVDGGTTAALPLAMSRFIADSYAGE